MSRKARTNTRQKNEHPPPAAPPAAAASPKPKQAYLDAVINGTKDAPSPTQQRPIPLITHLSKTTKSVTNHEVDTDKGM